MDPASLATAAASASTAKVQMAVAQKIMKMNADQGQAVAGLLEAAASNMKAMVANGVGGALDISV